MKANLLQISGLVTITDFHGVNNFDFDAEISWEPEIPSEILVQREAI